MWGGRERSGERTEALGVGGRATLEGENLNEWEKSSMACWERMSDGRIWVRAVF